MVPPACLRDGRPSHAARPLSAGSGPLGRRGRSLRRRVHAVPAGARTAGRHAGRVPAKPRARLGRAARCPAPGAGRRRRRAPRAATLGSRGSRGLPRIIRSRERRHPAVVPGAWRDVRLPPRRRAQRLLPARPAPGPLCLPTAAGARRRLADRPPSRRSDIDRAGRRAVRPAPGRHAHGHGGRAADPWPPDRQAREARARGVLPRRAPRSAARHALGIQERHRDTHRRGDPGRRAARALDSGLRGHERRRVPGRTGAPQARHDAGAPPDDVVGVLLRRQRPGGTRRRRGHVEPDGGAGLLSLHAERSDGVRSGGHGDLLQRQPEPRPGRPQSGDGRIPAGHIRPSARRAR